MMNIWVMALKIALIGLSTVFLGLLMLSGGIKIMSFCCRLVARREKKEEGIEAPI